MAQSPTSPSSPFVPSLFDNSPPALSPPPLSGMAPAVSKDHNGNSGGGVILLTLNNSGDPNSPSPVTEYNELMMKQSPVLSPLQQYADMMVMSPSPEPGLDIDKELELIRQMKDGIYGTKIGDDREGRPSLDILNLRVSHRNVDNIDLLGMVNDDDDQIVMEQRHYD
jgi:hypothetical protein